MKATQTVGSIFTLVVSLIGLTGILRTTSLAEPVTLPDWVKPIDSTLPQISPEVISEVDDIYWYDCANREYQDVPERKEKLLANDLRLVELREKAGQAMIWQYLKSTSMGGTPRVLTTLAKDRELAAWLLPILRFRIEWFKQSIVDDNMKEYSNKYNIGWELGEIEKYLTHQGDYSDIEKRPFRNRLSPCANWAPIRLDWMMQSRGNLPHDKLEGWRGEFWKQSPKDPFTVARDDASVVFPHGKEMHYSNPGIAMLAYAVTAATQKDLRELLQQRLWRPMGIADSDWSVGYEKTFPVDGLPLVATWGGASFTARAAARIGRLVLRNGNWDGKPLLSAEAVKLVTTDAGLPGHCGMGWWTNAGLRYTKLPPDAVWGAGAGDKLLLVVPSLDLIVVRSGSAMLGTKESDDDYRGRLLFEPIAAAIQDGASYPPSRSKSAIDTSKDIAPLLKKWMPGDPSPTPGLR